MEDSNSFHQLGSVEAGPLLCEALLLPQMEKEFATVAEVHHKVKFSIGLERVMQLDDKGAINLFKDIPLSYSS